MFCLIETYAMQFLMATEYLLELGSVGKQKTLKIEFLN